MATSKRPAKKGTTRKKAAAPKKKAAAKKTTAKRTTGTKGTIVAKGVVKREKGMMYFLDGAGNVRKTKMKNSSKK